MTTYRADVERDGKFWYIRVPQLDTSTQARHLRELDAMTRDLIANMAEVDPASFEIDFHIALPTQIQRQIDESAMAREVAVRAQGDAARLIRGAAGQLHAMGLPYRDIGQVLGVSFQRAKQLADEATDDDLLRRAG